MPYPSAARQGFDSPWPGQVDCMPCAPGYSSISGSACTKCHAGTSSDGEGGPCVACRAGTSSIYGGPCDAMVWVMNPNPDIGMEAVPVSSLTPVCGNCLEGTGCDKSTSKCENCPVNSYSRGGLEAECWSCGEVSLPSPSW
jgi:hypothetical protein